MNNSRDRAIVKVDEVPKLKINPDFADSWFDTPKSEYAADTSGYWPPDTNFPRVGSYLVPEAYKKKIPLPIANKCESKHLEDFLQAGKMDTNNNIKLNTLIFDKAQYKLPKYHLGPVLDAFIREELHDNLITDEILGLNDSLLDATLDEIRLNPSGLSADELLEIMYENIKTIRSVNTLGSQCNLRGRHSILASYTKNKMAMREEVIQDHSGSEHAKNILKGTSLFHKDLFGPLPESFRDNVLLSKGGQSHSLKFIGKKAPIPPAGGTPAKRPAPKQGGTPAKFHRGGSSGFRHPQSVPLAQQYQDSFRPQTSTPRGRGDNKRGRGNGRRN